MNNDQISQAITELNGRIEQLRHELHTNGKLSNDSVVVLTAMREQVGELRKIHIYQSVNEGNLMKLVAQANGVTVGRVSQICKEMREKHARQNN